MARKLNEPCDRAATCMRFGTSQGEKVLILSAEGTSRTVSPVSDLVPVVGVDTSNLSQWSRAATETEHAISAKRAFHYFPAKARKKLSILTYVLT